MINRREVVGGKTFILERQPFFNEHLKKSASLKVQNVPRKLSSHMFIVLNKAGKVVVRKFLNYPFKAHLADEYFIRKTDKRLKKRFELGKRRAHVWNGSQITKKQFKRKRKDWLIQRKVR